MSENKNPGQRSPQGGDTNKPNKQGGMGEKPVGNVGSQDPNKIKNPGQKQDIDPRSPQRPLDRDEDK